MYIKIILNALTQFSINEHVYNFKIQPIAYKKAFTSENVILIQWIPFICKAYLPEKILQLSGLYDKIKRYLDRKYKRQVP